MLPWILLSAIITLTQITVLETLQQDLVGRAFSPQPYTNEDAGLAQR